MALDVDLDEGDRALDDLVEPCCPYRDLATDLQLGFSERPMSMIALPAMVGTRSFVSPERSESAVE